VSEKNKKSVEDLNELMGRTVGANCNIFILAENVFVCCDECPDPNGGCK